MKKEILQAKTFTAIYDELEDRVRFIINYKLPNVRIDFMITRSFSIKMLPIIEDFIENKLLDQENDTIKKQSSGNQTKTQVQHIDSVVREELLLSIKLSKIKDTNTVLVIFESKNTEVRAILDRKSLQILLDNIKKAIPKYSWGIYF